MKKTYKPYELYEEFKINIKIFAKYNVDIEEINNFIKKGGSIEITKERYEKRGRITFSKKPETVEKEIIDARAYACYISSIGSFSDRVSTSYTFCGKIPTRISATSPDKEVKVVRYFKFIKESN